MVSDEELDHIIVTARAEMPGAPWSLVTEVIGIRAGFDMKITATRNRHYRILARLQAEVDMVGARTRMADARRERVLTPSQGKPICPPAPAGLILRDRASIAPQPDRERTHAQQSPGRKQRHGSAGQRHR